MKKTKIALILSASLLMSLGMASCAKKTTSSSEGSASETSSSATDTTPAATVTKITAQDLPLAKVNEEVDLDTYVVVTLSDGSKTSKEYTVTCSNAAVTFTGHKLKATAPGSFELSIASGNVSIRATIVVKTQTGIDLIAFFKQLDNNPLNYTEKAVKYNSTTKAWEYDGNTKIHNPKYYMGYDETNLKAVNTDGSSASEILATLSNGKSYWGALSTTTGLPVFDAGAVNFGDYYITEDLAIDGSAFVSTIDAATGEESISAPATVTSAIFAAGFGLSSSTLAKYDYTASTTEIVDVTRNTAGAITDAVIALNATNSEGATETIELYRLMNIGTSTIDFMETAITDASYIPADVVAPEVATEFAAVNTAANYTTTIDLYASDSKGAPIPTATVAATPANYNYTKLLGTTGLGYRQTSTVTSDGVFSKFETLNIATDIATATVAFKSEAAYFNRDSKGYKVAYSSKTSTATTAAIDGVTDVWTDATAKGMTTQGVTEAGVNNTEWTKKSTSGTAVTFEGKVGDNDGTTAKNVLFQQMFDQVYFLDGFGTYLTKAVDFSSSEKHALTIYSDWSSFTVDATAKTIAASALIYLPIGQVTGSAYMVMTYKVSAVGTTTNDFSGFVPATSSGSSSSSSSSLE